MDERTPPAGPTWHRRRRARWCTALVLTTAILLVTSLALPVGPGKFGGADADAGAAGQVERFRTGFPDAFVDNATGQATAMIGVNLRHAVSPNGWHMPRAELQHIADAGFNMVRLSLTWRDFEPAQGTYNEAAFTGLEALLDDLDAVGLHVILDPMHLKGAGERDGNWHEVPAWAWAIAPAVPNYAAAMDHMLARLDAHAGGYLTEMTRRVADRSAVIAIDLVNEP
jgi:hypothetical protein